MKLDSKKWYFATSVFVVAFLCVGPLALPLLWFNPRFSRNKKIIITVILLIITYYISLLLVNSIKSIYSYYQQIVKL